MTEEPNLKDVTVGTDATIADAMAKLDAAGTGALAVVDGIGRLLAMLTDGDIRRAVLRAVPLTNRCLSIATQTPLTAHRAIERAPAVALMDEHDVNHLPVVDDNGILVDILRRNDLAHDELFSAASRERLRRVVIAPSTSIAEALARLDAAGTGALALCREDRTLSGLLTDGDARRALLRSVDLNASCDTIATRDAIRASETITASEALRLMNQRQINHLPLVNDGGLLVGFVLRKDLAAIHHTDLSAVIMAGGYGKRLWPLTENVPKPMLPVGDRPLLERTITQLQRAGITNVNLTTHYLPQCIVDHFGDGHRFGVSLEYSREDQPLGTAGGLRLLKRSNAPTVVINGDVLTGVSFAEMLAYHRRHRAEMTVGVRKYEIQVPYGVVECDDVRVKSLREKPSQAVFINAGIYLLEPDVIDSIPESVRFDMTDLIQLLISQNRTVVSFPIIEYWLDVGRHEDYQKAQNDVRDGRI